MSRPSLVGLEVLVLGGDGILGHRVVQTLQAAGAEVRWTSRRGSSGAISFEAALVEMESRLRSILAGATVVINAIGTLRGNQDDTDDIWLERALLANAVLPRVLAEVAGAERQILHISTDAVFGPDAGAVDEMAVANTRERYGLTKRLGESSLPWVCNVRCSFVGSAVHTTHGLWDFVVQQPRGATVQGFTNHLWSGCTTHQLARFCADLIEARNQREVTIPTIVHFAPNPPITKYDLLSMLAERLRPDVKVVPVAGDAAADRVLTTNYPILYTGVRGWDAAFDAALPKD